MKHKSYFTLIEILVVISIIAVLCSMLLPALRNARETAKTIYCSNNEKQMGAALTGYMGDFNDWLPIANNNLGVACE